MRAAVSTSRAPWLTVTHMPDPVPERGDLVLRVGACGICGSDLHMAHKARSGAVFGHEFCGTVVGMGAEVDGYRDGDRVVGFPLLGCRRCAACLSGSIAKCPEVQLAGAQR